MNVTLDSLMSVCLSVCVKSNLRITVFNRKINSIGIELSVNGESIYYLCFKYQSQIVSEDVKLNILIIIFGLAKAKSRQAKLFKSCQNCSSTFFV